MELNSKSEIAQSVIKIERFPYKRLKIVCQTFNSFPALDEVKIMGHSQVFFSVESLLLSQLQLLIHHALRLLLEQLSVSDAD